LKGMCQAFPTDLLSQLRVAVAGHQASRNNRMGGLQGLDKRQTAQVDLNGHADDSPSAGGVVTSAGQDGSGPETPAKALGREVRGRGGWWTPLRSRILLYGALPGS